MPEGKPFRVLSLDGGGMRGTYTATYLSAVADVFAKRRSIPAIDVGAVFDLIVGTSTGGIIACALAAAVPLLEVVQLYETHGSSIFPRKVPKSVWGIPGDVWNRPNAIKEGRQSLRAALAKCLKEQTLGEIYTQRRIALAITAVEMSHHRSWVFKTPHLPTSNGRDNDYRLVDVCLATSAAPIFRSLEFVPRPDGKSSNVFSDGGLWANNPVLVGLIDALEMTPLDRQIEIYCLGTCPLPAGENVSQDATHRGLGEWRFGAEAASLAIDAQEFAYDNMARMLAKHVGRPCKILRFPREKVPGALMQFLALDDTRPKAIEALINQARTDADMTNSRCGDPTNEEGRLICSLFNDAPPMPNSCLN